MRTPVTKPTRYTKRERELAERFLALNAKLGDPTISDAEGIAARNELATDPILSRMYVSPLLAMDKEPANDDR